jgi:hypothetical protein
VHHFNIVLTFCKRSKNTEKQFFYVVSAVISYGFLFLGSGWESARGEIAMSKKIMVITETMQMEAELNDSKTAALIWEALPISAAANA